MYNKNTPRKMKIQNVLGIKYESAHSTLTRLSVERRNAVITFLNGGWSKTIHSAAPKKLKGRRKQMSQHTTLLYVRTKCSYSNRWKKWHHCGKSHQRMGRTHKCLDMVGLKAYRMILGSRCWVRVNFSANGDICLRKDKSSSQCSDSLLKLNLFWYDCCCCCCCC